MSLSYNPTISIPVHLYQDICVTTFTVIPMLAKYLKTDKMPTGFEMTKAKMYIQQNIK